MSHRFLTLSTTLALGLASALCAAGCGGSSGGGGAPPTTTSAPQSDQVQSEVPSSSPVSASQPSSSLSQTSSASVTVASSQTFAEVQVAPEFTFATIREVQFELSASDHLGQPTATRVEVLTPTGEVVFFGRTDAAGQLQTSFSVPTTLTTLRVRIAIVGVPSWTDVAVADQVSVTFGA